MIRRLLPLVPVPLAVLAGALSSAPWLRVFPAATIAVPLCGAALISVLAAVTTVRLSAATRFGRLPVTLVIGVLLFACYALLLVLKEPLGFADLSRGFVAGPAQILSFALPLVSPPSLLIWPVALCWLAGLLAGESLARARYTLLPYGAWLVVFAIGYAGTSRTLAHATSHRPDIALAGALLLCLGLLRVVQTWLYREAAAEATQLDSALPLRTLVTGTGTAVVVVIVAALAAQTAPFAGQPTMLTRVPAIRSADPTTPLAFVTSLRPNTPSEAGQRLFQVTVDRAVPGYFPLASVDFYDGDSWTFDRSFAPSGGVIPADVDPTLTPATPAVRQDYRVEGARLLAGPWMPFLYRPRSVSGVAVSVDTASGMIVPTGALTVGQRYTVSSAVPGTTIGQLAPGWFPATSAPPSDTELPPSTHATLNSVIASLATETGQPSSSPVMFLQAVTADLREHYLLARAPGSEPATTATPSPRTSSHSVTAAPQRRPSKPAQKPGAARSRPATAPKATPSASPSAGSHTSTGGTSLSAVLAGILGNSRTGTPEQYATLSALLARDLGIPARVVTGFRVGAGGSRAPGASHQLPAGTYQVTTADAYTWVEVAVRGQGWVVLDPSPVKYAAANSQPSVGSSNSPTPTSAPVQAPLQTQANGGHAVAPRSAVTSPPTRRRPVSWWWAVAAALGGAMLIVVSMIGRRRWRLVRRRRVTDPRLAITAAWLETLDVLAESGLSDTRALTAHEVVRATATRFGDLPAGHTQTIATLADVALYSERIRVSDADAASTWAEHLTLRRILRRGLPKHEQLLWLIRYRRAGRFRASAAGLTGRRASRPGRAR